MHPKDLLQKLKSKTPPVVVDVRSGFEYNSGHIPGAVHAPALKILFKMAQLPQDKGAELVVTCEHGPRARMAQGLLGLYGYRNVTLLEGHMAGWRRAGLKVVKLRARSIMPIFEYSCTECSSHFEKLQKSGTDIKPTCPACGSGKVQKKLSTFASPGSATSSAGCFSGG